MNRSRRHALRGALLSPLALLGVGGGTPTAEANGTPSPSAPDRQKLLISLRAKNREYADDARKLAFGARDLRDERDDLLEENREMRDDIRIFVRDGRVLVTLLDRIERENRDLRKQLSRSAR